MIKVKTKQSNGTKVSFSIFFAICFVSFFGNALASQKELYIVAHRGAKKDNQENTINAFKKALSDGADILEMDVQVTKDGVPVLYHPVDLKTFTDCSGKVEKKDYKGLQKCSLQVEKFGLKNIGTKNSISEKIPTLKEALESIRSVTIILDLKVKDVEKLIKPIAKVLNETKSWGRVIFYSTEAPHIKYLKKNYPLAKTFQDRDSTRKMLLGVKMSDKCEGKIDEEYLAFELKKDKFLVTEKLTVGSYETEVVDVILFDQKAINCVKSINPKVKIFLFGINTKEEYQFAKSLGIDGVVMDSLKEMSF